MSGIYIHIPFCRKACHYCNFHFSTSLLGKTEMILAIVKEINTIKKELCNSTNNEINTIYFGGGTPSLLTETELKLLLQAIYNNYTVCSNAEITLETNPDDHTLQAIKSWKAAGINRLSIGVQSFFEKELLWMNRAHNATQSLQCIQAAQDMGFQNLTIDLIYGTPTLNNDGWLKNLNTAFELNIPHLSCYALTIEPKTALHSAIKNGKTAPVDEKMQANQFLILMDWAKNAGMEHYEISNLAKPGHKSLHNSNYWNGKPYDGFGPSAHSFNGTNKRWWNVANNALYTKAILNHLPHTEIETLSKEQQINEYIMLKLRTQEGLVKQAIGQHFANQHLFESLVLKAKKYITTGKINSNNETLQLTNIGKLFADGIAADLFF